jgi:MraZ protein
MLLGHYLTKLGDKNRAAIPAKFRSELGTKVILAQWYENCLVLVSEEKWQKVVSQITEKPFFSSPARGTDRFLLGNAFELELDSQGRLVIPPTLCSYAGISTEIAFVGLSNRVEIWALDKWQAYQNYLDENAEEIADKLGQTGTTNE